MNKMVMTHGASKNIRVLFLARAVEWECIEYILYGCREKVNIPRTMRFITFVGDASDPPLITGNDTASSISGRGGGSPRTFQSATVGVDADYFVAINIKFEVIVKLLCSFLLLLINAKL